MQRSMRKVQGKLYRVALCLLFVVISGTLYYRQKASKPEKRLYDALENSTMKSQDEGPMRLCGLQSKFEEEGHLGDNLTLSSVFILVRHGERGPFNPILNSRNTHCGISAEEDNLKFKKYKRDISLVPLKDESFHQFDRTPPAGNWCRPGHLTTHGAFQHLSLGRSLREAYVTETGIPLAITVYLTHFARTFQSALALLFGLLGENVNQAAYELRGYGLMKHVLQTALSRPREEAVQVVIYSGHDYTVRNMLAFFGIPAETPAFAARIVWEFYHSSETAAAYLQHGFVQRLGATSFAGACKA
ncbi:unnamed protein product [Darwinula stevensoni]|uniref:2-phosphoxylose phosphatase 1 n=1 Tax=Darwinula stevensoni TaxID=69355 RepID=A0A7R9FP94_9CRUS|nr:unnamed protein product [Darwinula stevensoni]CAG0897621.1 unnamed protein product [Darwinula stevensoni]